MREALFLLVTLLAALSIWQAVRLLRGRVTVLPWQTGLAYRGGAFEKLLPPGRYWALGRTIFTLPATVQELGVSAQEVLAADRLCVKLSALLRYRITEPERVQRESGGEHERMLYTDLQLALRELAATRPLESLIDARTTLDGELAALLRPRIEPRGLALEMAALRDVILPPDLRRLYAETERARLEGKAALARAHGEQAALRALSNAARMLKGNPELMNLRILQAVQGQPGKTAPSVVLGAPGLAPVSTASDAGAA